MFPIGLVGYGFVPTRLPRLCKLETVMYREAPLTDVQQTASEMYRLAFAWKEDMAPYAAMSFPELFDFLKAIPWKADPPDTELLQRPWYTVTRSGLGGDCDDKAICVGAYCHLNGYPFRFVAVSRSPNLDLHHVFTEIMINGDWMIFDPTYAYNVLGRPMAAYAKRVVLTPR